MAVQVERPWELMAKGLDFGLGLWRLHTMSNQRHHLLYFIAYFQPISLDFQQILATHGRFTLWPSKSKGRAIEWPNFVDSLKK